ncbi:MAG: primosomal protein N' [Holdemanella sp.]|nr:primosomal protein N' [Holdemanella sp.]
MLINVYVEYNRLRNTFTYSCDQNVEVGCRVRVEFNNRTLVGFVEEVDVESDFKNIKPVIEVIDEKPLLNNELKVLANYMADFYASSKVTCYKTMLPPALRPSSKHSKIIYEDYAILNDSDLPLTSRQKEVLEMFSYPCKMSELRKVSPSITKVLLDKGYITLEKRIKDSNTCVSEIADVTHSLTSEQVSAIETIQNTNKTVSLLHGVTGSGKTEVFLRLAEDVLSTGKQVLFLVPEIGLTPMMIQRVQARFKQKIAIYHSGLNAQEKLEQYNLVKDHKVDIVVGTRSACFMPFSSLGLILMDEEHDSSYKQDNTPRYHTRDIVLFRAAYHKCKVVLASATPSLESYARAYKNVYELIELKNRIHEMPEICLVDMKKERITNGLSETLLQAIHERLFKNEQVILLLNRRGYLPVVRCSDCGHVRICPDCGVALTYHKNQNALVCHCCGRQFPFMEECPSCHSKNYFKAGMGTERLEEQILEIFKDHHVVRMDADSTRRKNAHEKLLREFEESGDLLIGTQMVAKGLDFERVTLVGILNADATLCRNDYRASETAYEMLEQASGRSGRGKLKGQVMIQTFDPDHFVMRCVQMHDYKMFFNQEMRYRHLGMYPPYVYLCTLVFTHFDLREAYKQASVAKEYFSSIRVLGPVEIRMQQKKHRVRLILKSKNDQLLHKVVRNYLDETKQVVDVNMHPIMMEE